MFRRASQWSLFLCFNIHLFSKIHVKIVPTSQVFSPLNFQTANLFYLPMLTILLYVQPSHSRPFAYPNNNNLWRCELWNECQNCKPGNCIYWTWFVCYVRGWRGCIYDVEIDQICNTREEVGNISIIFVGHLRGKRPLPIKIASCVGVSVMSSGETLSADVNWTEIARWETKVKNF